MIRKIKSLSMEKPIHPDLSARRVLLERKFYSERSLENSKTDRPEMLSYARMNESGIAKYRIIESMSYDPYHEFSLETLALVGTYDENFGATNFWGDYLQNAFPGNSLGSCLKNAHEGRKNKNWGLALKGSQGILEIDESNTFALATQAISFFHLGENEGAIDSWTRIENLWSIPDREISLFCRTLYNLRMFEEVVNVVQKISEKNGYSGELLEIGVRSLYNLKKHEECVIFCKILLHNDSDNMIAVRFLSRTLMRQRRVVEAIPILEKYCEINPNSVDAWGALIEANLVLDREDAAFSIRKKLLDGPIEKKEYLFTVIEILLKFRWEYEYRKLVERIEVHQMGGMEIGIAKIFLKLGNLSRAWGMLKMMDSDPMKSETGEEVKRILELTNTQVNELDKASKLERDVWIPELVTREIFRRYSFTKLPIKKKYCCHLISSSLDRGGAERQVAITMRNMSLDKSFNCSLAVHRIETDDGRGSYFGELGSSSDSTYDLQDLDLEIEEFPGKEIIEENEELINLLGGVARDKVKRLVAHFSFHKPDLIHAWQDETIFTSSLAAALTGSARVLGSARSLSPEEKTALHKTKSPYLRNCFREIFQEDGFQLSTNSFAGRESYAKWMGVSEGGIDVIHNGVDFKQMEKTGDSVSVRRKLGESGFSDDEGIIIGGIFRLEGGKRPELWIEAFERARDEIPSLKGVIIGGGKLENAVREWVKQRKLEDSIIIVGETENVAGWLGEMDVFLLTSSTEGLPNVIIEAQGFGVPVVSTDTGGVSEVVTNGVTGLIVDSSEAREIGDRLVGLISSERMPQMREASRLHARKRFSVEQMISKTRETYSRLLSPVGK